MNLQSQLIFGGFVFLLGLAAGLLIFWLTRDDDPKKQEKTSKRDITPTAHPPVGGAVKIGTIWRDETGRVMVQAPDGSLLEDEEARRLLKPGRTLEEQLDLPTMVNESLPPVNPYPRSLYSDYNSPQSLEGIAQPVTSKPVEPVSTNAVETLGRAFQNPKPPTPRSLAMQINDILQERIAGTDLARRGLRLVDLPNHDLGVEIDLHTYPGIDQVPDSAATQAIRDAAKVWQEKHR